MKELLFTVVIGCHLGCTAVDYLNITSFHSNLARRDTPFRLQLIKFLREIRLVKNFVQLKALDEKLPPGGAS